MAMPSFKVHCVGWTQIFLKYSMLGNKIFLVQLAKTRQAMRDALLSCCSLLKDLFLSCNYCWVRPILVGLAVLIPSPNQLPFIPPFPFKHSGSVVPTYSVPTLLPHQEVMRMGGENPTDGVCDPHWKRPHKDQTKNADSICIFLGNWTWHYWFPEAMLWKLVTISSKYREVEVKGIHSEKDK